MSEKRATAVTGGKEKKISVAAAAEAARVSREECLALGMIDRVAVEDLVANPLNRTFSDEGTEWEEFLASIREQGVRVPLQARWVVDEQGREFGEILAGHRRHHAATQCGERLVPVLWQRMDDGEALAFLVNENLQRLNLSPVDEARLCRAMREELVLTDEEISRRISRSVGWVRTRQLLLGLGDEVMDAVRSTDADRHLSLASVEEILRVPEELRERAVQLVLHPSFDTRPLRPEEARAFLDEVLVRPHTAERVWEGARSRVTAVWLKKLKKQVGAELADQLAVVAVAYGERCRERKGTTEAESPVPAEWMTAEAPAGLTYGMLAARHGLAVKVIPEEGGEQSEAVVAVDLLMLAEQTLLTHGGVPWLRSKRKAAKTDAEERSDEGREQRIRGAVAELDGEGGEVPDEAPERVISQGMDWFGMIDLGAVKRVAMWAVSDDADPMNAPEWVPKWALKLGEEGMWGELDGALNWIMELRTTKTPAGKTQDLKTQDLKPQDARLEDARRKRREEREEESGEVDEEIRYSNWTEENLEETFAELMEQVGEEKIGEYLDELLADGTADCFLTYVVDVSGASPRMRQLARRAGVRYRAEYLYGFTSEEAMKQVEKLGVLSLKNTTEDMAKKLEKMVEKLPLQTVLDMDLFMWSGSLEVNGRKLPWMPMECCKELKAWVDGKLGIV